VRHWPHTTTGSGQPVAYLFIKHRRRRRPHASALNDLVNNERAAAAAAANSFDRPSTVALPAAEAGAASTRTKFDVVARTGVCHRGGTETL